jgi:hypothetical protein
MKHLLRSIIVFALSVLSMSARPASTSSKPVHVRQYTRKDGTVVSAHTRSTPGSAAPRSASTFPKTRSSSQTIASRPTQPSSSGIQRTAQGRIERSAAAKHAFEASQRCPATGRTSGPCKGYVIDHVKPLACGGTDAPSNMQWQSEAAAKIKDRTERAGCGAR